MKKLKYLLFLLPLIFIQDTFALNLAPYTYAPTQGCSTSNRYSYTLRSDALTYRTGIIGSGGSYNVSGVMSAFSAVFNYNLKANNDYSISLRNPNNSPFWYKPDTQLVYIAFSNNFNKENCGNVVTRINPTKIEVNSTYLTIYFTTPSTSYSSFGLEINDDLNGYTLTGGSNFRINNDINLVDESAVSEDENTQNIIDNNNQNTQDIIDNQNENTDKIIDELTDCRPSNNMFPGWILYTGINSTNGAIVENENGAISSDYIKVDFNVNSSYYLSGLSLNLRTFVAAYNSNKEFLGRTDANYRSGILLNSDSFGSGTAQGTGAIAYLRVTSYNPREGEITQVNDLKTMFNVGSSAKSYEPFGEEICQSKIDDVKDGINDLNDTLTDDNVDNSINEAGNFFSSFQTDDYGLSAIITAPLNLIKSITNNTCNTLILPLPYVDSNLELPCMNSIYSRYFGSFLSVYQTITFGIVSYWVIVRIFNMVKDFKNPDHDEIEVVDL